MKHVLHGSVDSHLHQTQFTDCRPVVRFQAHCLECKVCKALLLEFDAQCLEETLVEETKKITLHSHLCRETLLMHSTLFHISCQMFFNVISQCL